MKYSPTTKGFYPESRRYPNPPSDLLDVADEYHAELMAAQRTGKVIVPDANGFPRAVDAPVPSAAELRAVAVLDRTSFCLALKDMGVLPAAEAVAAARGEWPATFASFTAALTADQAATAMIRWAGAQAIHYADPLLQGLALVATSGDQTAATALLDQIFGLA